MNNNFHFETDKNDFICIATEKFKKNEKINLVITGNSMIPFLVHKRDTAVLSKFFGEVKKGDILLYFRDNGKYILHRVYDYDEKGVYFVGDSQNYIEGPVPYENILAECTCVLRKGKLIEQQAFVWKFFSKIWIRLIFIRQPIIRLITEVNKFFKNNV